MMSPPSDIKALPVIAVAITSAANIRLMESVFHDTYQLCFGLDHALPHAPDLLIADTPALSRHHSLIQDMRRDDEPMILPVLLISPSKQLPTMGVNRALGTTVDDILRIPTSRAELRARVDNLLRLRLLSRQQEVARTELAGVVEEIHSLAFSDALTGLPNRHYLVNYIENMLANNANDDASSAAILFIDLDGFKLINDVLGHEAGDQVLIQVARRLQNAVRETDLVIRHGGDEFLVVLFDAPRTQPALTPADPGAFIKLSEELARRIIDHIKEPIVICEQEHRINASIGISLCPDHGRDASTVIQAADNAMYDAKRSGGGCSHLYSPEILEKRHQRLSLEARLRHAIANDELVLHFQPLFHLEDLSTVGVEALARWPQADGTMIMPGDFIPVAEETGLIRPLGDWALAAGAQQLQSWHKQGYPLQLAVNLSVHQLYPDGDADHLLALVKPWIDPAWITLEITESVLMVDPSAIETLLRELKSHGFRIAIDDFGTGYSSLSRLQGLPLDTLKIDRSFVNQLDKTGEDDSSGSMIAIIQQMATSFGLNTVAEGIETADQYHQLKAAGVQLAQGFWFGRPVPAADIRQRIDESRKQDG